MYFLLSFLIPHTDVKVIRVFTIGSITTVSIKVVVGLEKSKQSKSPCLNRHHVFLLNARSIPGDIMKSV